MRKSIYTTSKEIKARTFAENELVFATLTNIPITPGHSLVIPKRVVATFEELTEQELYAIQDLSARVKESLRVKLSAQGFNCAFNEGANFGQSIPHFHLHIVPRKDGDTGIETYEPREFLYRPGSRETTPESELASLAAMLRTSE